MNVKQAKELAIQWVNAEASNMPGFYGAYFVGSINWMADEDPFPISSDVDISIVLDTPQLPDTYTKSDFRNLVLDTSFISKKQFQSADTILSDYPSAGHFTRANIIADPSGQLARIQAVVKQSFAKRQWVRKRCENARDLLLASLTWMKESDSFHDQVFACLYASSIPNHIVLVADLKNPTTRKMYVASREVLEKYGFLSLHEDLLNLLGSARMSPSQVQELLGACAEVFDNAKQVVKTPFFGSTSISDAARPIAIDGSRELIEGGYHREAVFWIAVTQTWCQKALANDASVELQQRFAPSYLQLMSALGVKAYADLRQRNEQLRHMLPRIWEVTESIITANKDIID